MEVVSTSGNRSYLKMSKKFAGYDTSAFVLSERYKPYLKCVLVPEGLIQDRIERLASDILEDFLETPPFVAICILKGAHKFFVDLLKAFDKCNRLGRAEGKVHYDTEFVRISSYQDDRSGEMTISEIFNPETVAGRDVLVVEDIIDSGKTILAFVSKLRNYQPRSIRVVALMKKTGSELVFKPDYVGFEVPKEFFVVGYDFDFNEVFRDLNHICLINDDGKEEFKKKQ